MKFLYLYLNIGSLIIPFLFSFHPKIKFYKKWKSFLLGTLVMMLIFISWDVLFTNHGIWGFNEKYLIGYHILNLPVEEWLFFICIPYACIFTHFTLIKIYPNFTLPNSVTKGITLIIILFAFILLITYSTKWYTVANFSYLFVLLMIVLSTQPQLLQSFYLTFLVILFPFFIVNGILTGTGLEEPVVWYNNSENLGFRMFTIPFEDLFYALNMLLTILLIMNFLEKNKNNNNVQNI